jgi:hypothetical protein
MEKMKQTEYHDWWNNAIFPGLYRFRKFFSMLTSTPQAKCGIRHGEGHFA